MAHALARRTARGILLVLVAGALAACGGGSSESVVIYSGRTEQLIGPLLDRFADETGIDVQVRYGDSADLALLLEQEGDRSPADVFLSQSPGPIGHLGANGRLARLPDDVLDAVPPEYRSGRRQWIGLSGRVRVLVYNTEEVAEPELPARVWDLTDPRFRGRFGVAPTNGSFQDFVSAMRISQGDDRTSRWLRGIHANGARTYANNVAIVEAVARGEIEMGLVNHYYNHRQLAEDPDSPTRNHAFPASDIGSLIIVSGVGVLEGAPHRENAERLVAFLASAEAQRYFADETFEYPLAAGARPAATVPAVASLGAHRIPLDDLGQRLDRTKALIEQSGLERS